MRNKIVLVFLAVIGLLGAGSSFAPVDASSSKPVEVRRECGGYNVYVNGSPLIHYVWCPDYE